MAKQDKQSAERERAQEPERQKDKIEDLELSEEKTADVKGGFEPVNERKLPGKTRYEPVNE